MSTPARLYLIHQYSRELPIPSGSLLMSTGFYLVQTDDSRNVVVDSGMPPDMVGTGPFADKSPDVLAQLEALGVRPKQVDIVICTHFDIDHVGHHELFTNAMHVVQRQHYEVAAEGADRFQTGRSHWDAPGLK